MRMFDMSNDSGLFVTLPRSGYVPLYESKMFYQFTHRYGDYSLAKGERKHVLPDIEVKHLQDPNYSVSPYYWVPKNEVDTRLYGKWSRDWLLGFRDVTDSRASIRTVIFSILPRVGFGNNAPIMFFEQDNPRLATCLLANLCSLVFDFVARQKVSGLHLNFFLLKQLPALPPVAYTPTDIEYISLRVLELVYTAYDLKPFAEDMGYHGEPFRWDEERRTLLRAELDAYYAKLYGLTRDELRYILDPQDVYGPDFPGETFRVLKEKEIRQFGEYRTRRLVLEAWDRLEGVEVGNSDWQVANGENTATPPVEQPSVARSAPPPAPPPAQPTVEKPRPHSKEASEAQPMLSDFGLYQCEACGKMVMGFDKETHLKEKHGGSGVEWKKVR